MANKKILTLVSLLLVSFLLVGCFLTPGNNQQPPEITSDPVRTAIVGVAYTYDVEATDPEGDTLTYSLTEWPAGMSIVATTGVITWIPAVTGFFPVTVVVSDGKGLSDTQDFIIVVLNNYPTPIIGNFILSGE